MIKNTIFLFSVMMLMSVSAMAARTYEIAATVNEDAVSQSDVDQRMALFFASSGMRPTEENIEKARPQVLDVLIEEQLKFQEAARQNLSVTDEEIDEAFSTLSKQNNLEPDQFEQALASQGIPKSTMLSQIKSQVAWTKIVTNYLRPQVNVTENDVESKKERLRANLGMPEYQSAEIFLPVTKNEDEEKIRELASKLISEIQNGNAPFGLVAAQFSKSASAKQGGQMGWVSENDVPKEIALVLKSLKQGEISTPVRGLSGFHILTVLDTRLTTEETLPPEEDILNSIGLERLDRLQQRHLSDLKAAAFIERRF